MQQQQLFNLVEALKKGQPAAIFEDPFPMVMPQTVGTSFPNPPQGGMFGMGGQSAPKGDINALWKALEIQVTGFEGDAGPPPGQVVWQDYPYQNRRRELGPSWSSSAMTWPATSSRSIPKRPQRRTSRKSVPVSTGISQRVGAAEFTELVSPPTASRTIEAMEFQAALIPMS
jgi:hypothetical protein